MSELSIEAAAAEAPDRVGLIIGDRAHTFAELAAGARAAAAELGDRAVIIAERTLATVHTVLAALEARVPVVLIHPRATPGERMRLAFLATHVEPDPELAAVLFTSGSSAVPKAVLLDRAAFVASARASAARLGWRDGDRWLCPLPLAHIGGLSILVRSLIARRCVVLDPEGSFEPRRLIDIIARERVTLLSLVPTQLDRLLDAGWAAPAHLRAVLLGGAAASFALIERAYEHGVPVLVTYGMTEACSQISTQVPGTRVSGPGHVGPPLPGVEVRIVDERVQVRGPILMRGYLGAAAAIDADGWFDTGDVGWLDADGSLHVAGRGDDTIITGGENVHPAEVEAVLARHPAIQAACVFAVPDPTWGEIIAAAVVLRAERELAWPDLAWFVAENLASHKRPRYVAALDALPLNATGKPDRARAAELARDRLSPLRAV